MYLTQPIHRAALLSMTSDRYLETCFAVWWADAVIVPMNTRWSVAECAVIGVPSLLGRAVPKRQLTKE